MERLSLSLMNLLTEKKYSENELIPIINQTDGKVNEENEIYQNILILMKYAIPVNYVDEIDFLLYLFMEERILWWELKYIHI